MRFDLARPLPPANFPDSISLAPYSAERDDEIRRVFNQAFAGHWIGELSPEEWQQRFIATPQFKPELAKLALTDDRVAGFYLSKAVDKQRDYAWLEIVGVLPEQRGKGLGTALTADSLNIYKQAGFAFCRLGVDDENVHEDLRLWVQVNESYYFL